MIWSVVLKSEMEGFGTLPVFRFYQEALGRDNITLAVVNENDNLDFVKENDVVLLRSANKSIIDTIIRKKISSTAETNENYDLVKDKALLAVILKSQNIIVPRQYDFKCVQNECMYFVKPRYGSDSFGISHLSICKTKNDVIRQISCIHNELSQDSIIEDFIEGIDCTVACWRDGNEINTCAIEIECPETDTIQTKDSKIDIKEFCSPLHDDTINGIAKRVFEFLGLKHHARIDFRRNNNGTYYLIDVNLIPGLGPIDHFAKCLLLSRNMSYRDAMLSVVNSACCMY